MNAPAIHNTAQQRDLFAEQFGQFFIELQTIFPAWRHALPTTEHLKAAKRQWFKAFQESGITTAAQIAAGLRKARAEGGDFWPSPSTFVAWCKPSAEDFGLPDQRAAFREAIDNAGRIDGRRWTHAAVYHAANQVGLYDLAQMTADKAEKAFLAAYAATCKAVIAGEALPEVPKAIERAAPVKAREATASRYMAEMRAKPGRCA